MKLEIDKALAQRILDHLATNPTGSASWKSVNEMIQAIVALKPVAEQPAEANAKAPSAKANGKAAPAKAPAAPAAPKVSPS